jgi:hypothetical protein
MALFPVFRTCSLLLLGLITGCATAKHVPGEVALRSDGTPGPEECSAEAMHAMRILGLKVDDGAMMELDVNQTEVSPIYLHEGELIGQLNGRMGPLGLGTLLYGRAWTRGPQVVIRYYEARPPTREKVPICATARLARGNMRKMPGSKPDIAILEFSSSAVFIVDRFL